MGNAPGSPGAVPAVRPSQGGQAAAGILAGYDLSGLGPEELAVLMRGQLARDEIRGRTAQAEQEMRQRNAQNLIANYYREIEAQRAAGKDQREAETHALAIHGLKQTSPYEADGKLWVDILDASGQRIRSEERGTAPQTGGKWFKMPDGTSKRFFGDAPANAIPIGERDGGLTANQEFNQGNKLADYRAAIVKGDLEPEIAAGYAKQFNQYSKDEAILQLPEESGIFGSSATFLPISRTAPKIVGQPNNRVVMVDDKGRNITIEMINMKAEKEKVPVYAIMKHLGLVP